MQGISKLALLPAWLESRIIGIQGAQELKARNIGKERQDL